MVRLVGFTALWVLLAGFSTKHGVISVVAVVGATSASYVLWVQRSRTVSWSRLPALLFYFGLNSLRGGFDVARRSFTPAMPLDPGLIDYECSLRTQTGQVLFIWMIGLMPGTASVDWKERGVVVVHVIDRGRNDLGSLRQLELKIGAVLEPQGPGSVVV